MCEEATNNYKLIGIWMSEKKFQKLRWGEFVAICRNHGYDVIKLDLERPLEDQGPLQVFIHKLTDIIAAADQGDLKSQEVIGNVEQYISNHPNMTVIDPLDNVRILLDRYRYYSLIENQPLLQMHGVFTPTFAILTSNSHNENMNLLRARKVTFPLVCKPIVAHGSKSAHKMSVVFNEAGLAQCKLPCVVQSFINHNAVLYKIYMVGNRYYVVERPSLKNFYSCNEKQSIHFHSGDVCKADSQSTLSILDPHELTNLELKATLDDNKLQAIIRVLRDELKLVLFGVDIVIDNVTNQYAIIDINVYPGYEGYPNFFENLVDSIDELVESKLAAHTNNITNGKLKIADENTVNVYRNKYVSSNSFDKANLINVNRETIENYYPCVLSCHHDSDMDSM